MSKPKISFLILEWVCFILYLPLLSIQLVCYCGDEKTIFLTIDSKQYELKPYASISVQKELDLHYATENNNSTL
jgi:hypothetical protein